MLYWEFALNKNVYGKDVNYVSDCVDISCRSEHYPAALAEMRKAIAAYGFEAGKDRLYLMLRIYGEDHGWHNFEILRTWDVAIPGSCGLLSDVLKELGI